MYSISGSEEVRKIIFFLYYRSGSTLFEHLCGKEWRRLQNLGLKQEASDCWLKWRKSGELFFLPTIPPNICPSEDISLSIEETPLLDYRFFSWMYHVGNWWGDLKSKDIPGPYDIACPSRWGPDELLSLPGKNWVFIALVRDGRDQIESLRNMKGGVEEQFNKEDPEDYFKALCLGYRNRTRMVIDCCKRINNYHLFKYEYFIVDPIETIRQMFSIIGLDLDIESCRRRLDEINQYNIGKKHSSFGDQHNAVQRWKAWSNEELDIFDRITGKELRELGYI